MPQHEDPPDFEVGYARPPAASKFRRGRSGNPTGRPKGSRGLSSVLMATLKQKVTITENGREKRVTKLTVITKQLVNSAATGNLAATRLLLGMVQLLETHVAPNSAEPHFRESDHRIITQLQARLARLNMGE